MAWTEPRTWLAETMSAGKLNEQLRDNFKAVGDEWTMFTPSHSGSWTTGNGQLEGWYVKAGRFMIVKTKFTFGSTSTASGNFGLILPWTQANGSVGGGAGDGLPVGRGACFDASSNNSSYRNALVNGATLRLVDDSGALVNATVPFTPAAGDIYTAQVRFEASS